MMQNIVKETVFYGFASISILSAVMVILSKNTVRSALWLVLCFFAMAPIWILLQAEFLAGLLILVYVGAVIVLFLFVVMMLDIDRATQQAKFVRFFPLGVCVALLVVLGLVVIFRKAGLSKLLIISQSNENFSNTFNLGKLLYTQYLYPFEIAGILLLVAIIAAISLSFRKRRKAKCQNPGDQVITSASDRIKLVSVKSECSQ